MWIQHFLSPAGPRYEDAAADRGRQSNAVQDGTDGTDLNEEQIDNLEESPASGSTDLGDEVDPAAQEDLVGADYVGEIGDAHGALMEGLQTLLEQKRAEEAGAQGLSKADQSSMSAHERRVARMAERARKLEEENLGEKQWFMRGEAKAGVQPSSSLAPSHCQYVHSHLALNGFAGSIHLGLRQPVLADMALNRSSEPESSLMGLQGPTLQVQDH